MSDDETEVLRDEDREQQAATPDLGVHPSWLAMRLAGFVNGLVFVTLLLVKLFAPKVLSLVDTQTLLCAVVGANTIGWYAADAFVHWLGRAS